MKIPSSKTARKELASFVEVARLRVATAKGRLKAAKPAMSLLILLHVPRGRLLAQVLILVGLIAVPLPGFSQTPGMLRRQDRRDDRGNRVQQRDEKMVKRRDDPMGIRGPQRREDRRDIRTDRKTDRRERVY